jgi:pectin methylesterase-like acyl-CoA thioesterase
MSDLRLAFVTFASIALAACANSETSADGGSGSGGSNATGGRSAQGGANGTGGVTATGGNGSGGSVGAGGSVGTGGVGTGGAAGARATGGTSGGTGGTAGAGAKGGATGSGGTGTGGASATGGTTGQGGRGGTAGKPGTGGTNATGGTTGTGGTAATGGTTGTGGSGNAPGNASSVYPPVNGTNVCPDPQLRITFAGATPSIGSSGLIQVFNSSGTAVASVDVGASSYSTTNGGMAFTIQRPVYVDGNTVVVYLPSRPLTYNQTYYVNVASGAIKNSSGAAFVVTGSTAWRFTTAAAAPTNKAAVSVALDGSAPFCSLQGALDFVPANNTAAVTVSLANGTYHELVYFTSKSNVTIQGASQAGTVIEGTNNNNLNPSTKGRALVGGTNTNGLTVNNLTIHNLTPQGGSQAEALRLEGCDKCVVTNSTIISLQDTLLWSGRIYAKNDLIEGNVDFVWGTGAVYFDSCEIRTIGRSGPVVQSRNPASTYGYVFVDSKLTADSGLTGGVLARIDASVYPASHVAYVNCQMSSEIAAAGWQLTGGTATSALRFWEYQSVDPGGKAIDVSKRLAGSMQITSSEATMMRTPSVVLAGWQPPGT